MGRLGIHSRVRASVAGAVAAIVTFGLVQHPFAATTSVTTHAVVSDIGTSSLQTKAGYENMITPTDPRISVYNNAYVQGHAFMSFSNLPGGTYTAAKLRLRILNGGSGISVYKSASAFSNTTTWLNEPAAGTKLSINETASLVASTTPVDITLNPTALTNLTSLSIKIVSRGTDNVIFSSKEFAGDNNGPAAQLILSRAVQENAPAVAIGPSTIATKIGSVGHAFSTTLTSDRSASWSITSGQLPPGLSISNGVISGTPKQAGVFTFKVHAVASDGGVGDNDYSLFIDPDDGGGYRNRVNSLIDEHMNAPWPTMSGCTDHNGYLYYANAALWNNQNVSDANNKLAAVQLSHLLNNYCKSADPANSLWLTMLVRDYMLYNSQSSFFPGRMSSTAANNLIAQMWAYSKQYSGLEDAATSPWRVVGSENLYLHYRSNMLLSAQMFKNNPTYATKLYNDGNTPATHYNAWRAYWSKRLDEMAKKGGLIEVASPSYFGYTMSALLNVYQFSEDPELRKKAEMVLDIIYTDYAETQVQNVWGSAKSRAYTDDLYSGAGDASTSFGDLLWGSGAGRNNHNLYLATSGYNPPEQVLDLARDRSGRGSYEVTMRRPGAGASTIDPTRSVLHYAYVNPDYIMGSAMLDPDESYPSVSAQNRWQGVIFNTNRDARVYTQAGLTNHSGNMNLNSFYTVQHKGVMVTHKNANLATQPTLVYFAASLDSLVEDSGWIFVDEGNSYLAVRPQTGGYSWLTTSKNKASDPDNRFIKLSTGSSPIIMEAGRSSEYADFTAFKNAIKNRTRSYVSGVTNYVDKDGNELRLYDATALPRINNVSISVAPTRVYNSPFMQSTFDSGVVTISYGGRTTRLDFSDPSNPVKTET